MLYSKSVLDLGGKKVFCWRLIDFQTRSVSPRSKKRDCSLQTNTFNEKYYISVFCLSAFFMTLLRFVSLDPKRIVHQYYNLIYKQPRYTN